MRLIAVITFACSLVLVATAIGATITTYTGTTSEGDHFSLDFNGQEVDQISYLANYTCTDHFHESAGAAAAAQLKVTDGKFSGKVEINQRASDVTQIAGTFSGDKVTGSFSETYRRVSVDGAKCSTGNVTFTAKR